MRTFNITLITSLLLIVGGFITPPIGQIDLKDYSSKFALSGLPIVKVGINFDAERRTIGDWKIM